MKRNFLIAAAAAGALLFVGCNIFIQLPETTISASNEMVDFDMIVKGRTWAVEGIDLYNVTIGDVSFSSLPAGHETEPVVTGESGNVDVYIGKAIATVDLPGPTGVVATDYEFTGIDAMELTLDEGEDNKVVFDDATSQEILSALGKKLASK